MDTLQDSNASEVESYLLYLQNIRRLSELTIVSYRHDLDLFLQFLLKQNISLRAVTPMDARRYSAKIMSEKNYKIPSVNRMLSTLRSLYRYLLKRGRCRINPFARIESSTRYRRLPELLSRQEIIQILSVPIHSFADLRNSAMFHLFYSTGCRLAELLDSNIDDIDFEQERLLVKGKGNRQRYVFLNPATVKLLQRYLNEREGFLLQKGIVNPASERAIFIGMQGKRLSASSVHSIFEKYRLKLGMHSRFTPHMLRHSFATHLLDNDSGIQIVQQLLGHASISTTQIYTHVSHQRLRAVYEKSHPHGRKRDGD